MIKVEIDLDGWPSATPLADRVLAAWKQRPATLAKDFYIHVGTEKCASSLIEKAFHRDDDERGRMASQGIWSLHPFQYEMRQLQTFDAWSGQTHESLRWRYIAPLLQDRTTKAAFWSEEWLLGLSHWHGREPSEMLAQRCEFIKRAAVGWRPHVILVVRRQDGYFESAYNQAIKRGETRSFGAWIGVQKWSDLQWDRIADAFAGAFGADRLTVISHKQSSVLAAVANIIGLSPPPAREKFATVNPSLPFWLFPTQITANQTLPAHEAAKVADVLSRTFPKDPKASAGVCDDETREKLVGVFAESNKRLVERWLPRVELDHWLNVGHTLAP